MPRYRCRKNRAAAIPVRILLAVCAVIACLAVMGVTPARAGTDCDTSEQVACIPAPSDTSTAPTGSQSSGSGSNGPSAAAAAPIFCAPPGCCGAVQPGGPLIPSQSAVPAPICPPPVNPCYPYVAAPQPAPASGSAAAVPVPAPAPAPVSCSPYRSIYSTINLGNAADVRALRTVTTDGLSRYWRQSALYELQSQVDYLQSAGDYANTRLYSIQVQSATLDLLSSTARVQTLEHWLYQERSSYDGSLVYSTDEWVTNNYVLSQSGNTWYITSDAIRSLAVPGAVPAGG